MRIGEIATIRTGLVLSRKESSPDKSSHTYRVLSLKNVNEDGEIFTSEVEDYYAAEALKREYFTHIGDVLFRLSAPYTVVLITEMEENLLVPSHFAIIRVVKAIDASYLHWWLVKNRKRFYQMASGGTMMGTISSGYIADMSFEPPPLVQQRQIAKILELASRERQLLSVLSEKKKLLIDATIVKIVYE